VSDRHEILVVDDDEDTRLVLQDLLELNGFAVRACPDARHALEAARAAPPALMLVDYFMPDADGAWVVQQLRAAGLGRVPVVLTTGSNEGRGAGRAPRRAFDGEAFRRQPAAGAGPLAGRRFLKAGRSMPPRTPRLRG